MKTTKVQKLNNLKKSFLLFCLYALSGALSAISFIFPSLWVIGWIAPCAVFFYEFSNSFTGDTYFRAWLRGICFFWFFGFLVFSWFLYLYPLDFLGFDPASAIGVITIASGGIPLLQSLSYSFVFVYIRFLRKRKMLIRHPFFSACLIAASWTVCEFLQTLTWAGVPWGRLAVGQVGCLANIQSASLFGSYFITFIMVFSAALISHGLILLKDSERKRALFSLSLALCVFLSNFAFGSLRIAFVEKSLDGEKITAAAIQGNIEFEDKWDDKITYTIEKYRSLSLEAAKKGADILVWPETAIPYDYYETTIIPDFFRTSAKDTGAEIIATSFMSDHGDIDTLYNTAMLIYPDGSADDAVYAKRRLVPFGEFIPMEKFIETVFPPLANMSAIEYPLTPGNKTALFDSSHGKIASLICFDSIYETLCLESVRDGANLIVISTNDSWFAKSPALAQHNAQAQLRAVENCRYTVRSANTGISSVISPTGKVISSLGDSKEGYVMGEVQMIEKNTLYTVIGNSFVVICAAVCLGTVTVFILLSLKEKNKKK